MNELTLLRTLRDDVPEPTPEQLAPNFDKLEAVMRGDAPHTRRAQKAGWVLAAAAAAVVLTVVAGNINLSAQSAHAASVLRDTAASAISFEDAIPGPGQYLLAHTYADWSGRLGENIQTLDVYVPYDRTQEWVLERTWTPDSHAPWGTHHQILRAVDGAFYPESGPWIWEDLDALPRDGRELLAYFDSKYTDGSNSRDEDNFVRIVEVLRSGLVPADLRAGLYNALALIPGVSSTANVANLDGEVGIAIGRAEPLRNGVRQEIIISPETGQVIGMRDLSTLSVFGVGTNKVMSLTAVETTVVDSAP